MSYFHHSVKASVGWLNYASIVLYHVRKLWESLASRDHSCLKTEVRGKQEHALRRNFAPKMCRPMKTKQVKDNNVEESRPLGHAVLLGRLNSHSRVTTDRQSATWSARALGRGLVRKISDIVLLDKEVETLEVFVEEVWRYVKSWGRGK